MAFASAPTTGFDPVRHLMRLVLPIFGPPTTHIRIYSAVRRHTYGIVWHSQQTNLSEITPACTRFSCDQADHTCSIQWGSGNYERDDPSACTYSKQGRSCSRAPCVQAARSVCKPSRSDNRGTDVRTAGSCNYTSPLHSSTTRRLPDVFFSYTVSSERSFLLRTIASDVALLAAGTANDGLLLLGLRSFSRINQHFQNDSFASSFGASFSTCFSSAFSPL